MHTETVLVPGPRDVRGTLATPADPGSPNDSNTGRPDAAVVACPPHPQHGGSRRDGRLRALSDALVERGIASLRIDYGQWNEGRGERRDVERALGWARDRFERAGLFGYSFGATMALLATVDGDPDAVVVVAPHAPAADALDSIACPVEIVYGERDTTVDWEPVVDRARGLGHEVVEWSADHYFVGQEAPLAEAVAARFVRWLR